MVGSRPATRARALCNMAYRGLRAYLSRPSPRQFHALMCHARSRLRGLATPVWVTVAPTYRCQCRCVHCYAEGRGRTSRTELDTAAWRDLLSQVRGLAAIQVTFSGGEPLLRDDIVDLVAHAHHLGLVTRINTNGILLSRSLVRELGQAGLNHCGVSLDDADGPTHDALRGFAGAHAAALAGIRQLRAARIPCQILTYARRETVTDGLKRTIALGRRLGVMSTYIFFPGASGLLDGRPDVLLTEAEKARVRSLHDYTFVHVEVPTPRSLCRVFARNVLYIDATAMVTPCPFVPYAVGNARRHGLESLWRRYCDGLELQFRGDCVMNDRVARDALRGYVARVRAAAALRRPG
jgi:MoaA/NifB/PqqE/SkfB family radical SAM enzyme